ncbi:MAG: hypothetical protein OHK0022_46660 [Roseiflexaceae bacterium]
MTTALDAAGWLPELWRTRLLACSQRSQADACPDALLALLALSGATTQAVRLAEQRTQVARVAEGLVAVAGALARRNQASDVLALCHQARALGDDRATLRGCAVALFFAGRQDDALRLIAATGDVYQQIMGHERVVEALVWSGHTTQAHTYAAARTEGLMRSRTLLRLVELLCEDGCLDEAAAAAAAIPASEAQARALGDLATAQARAGMQAAASASADTAVATARSLIDTPEHRDLALRGAVRALVRAGRAAEVEALGDAFPERSLRQYAWEEGMKVLLVSGQIAQANVAIGRINHEPTETGFRMGAALELARAGRVEQALTIAGAVPEPANRSLVVRTAAIWLARAAQIDDAVALVERLVPDFQQTAILAEVVLTLAHRYGIDAARAQIPPLLQRLRAQPASFWRSWELARLARLLAEGDRPVEARTLLGVMHNSPRRFEAVPFVAAGLAQANRVAEAVALAATVEPPVTPEAALMEIAITLAKTGRTAEALQLAGAAEGEQQLNVYGRIARAAAAAGQAEVAEGLLARLPDDLRSYHQHYAAQELARIGEFANAVVLARGCPNPGLRAGALGTTAEALVQAGQRDAAGPLAREATELLLTTPLPFPCHPDDTGTLYARSALLLRNEALDRLAVVLAQTGQPDLAVEVAGRMIGASFRAKKLGQIAALRERPSGLSQALALAEAVPPASRPAALWQMAQDFAAVGQPEEAITLTTLVEEPSHVTSVRGELAALLAQGGWTTEAWRLTAAIEDAYQQQNARREVVRVLTLGGRLAEAEGYVDDLAKPDDRVQALSLLARAYAEQSRWEETLRCAQQAVAVARTATRGPWLLMEQITLAISSLTHLPTVARFVRHAWAGATTENELLALLPAAAPLLIAQPTLLGALLAGCDWVEAQVRV